MIPDEGINTGSVGRRGAIEWPGSQPTDKIVCDYEINTSL